MSLPEASPQKSLRESHKDLTRRRICAAARHCFIEKGADSTSVEEIVARAGISRATFYLHYASKTDVLVDIVRDLEQSRRELCAQLLYLPEVNLKSVRDWLRLFIDTVSAHSQGALRIIEVGRAAHAEAQNIILQSRAMIVQDLGRRYERFRVPEQRTPADERKLVEAFMMLVQVEQFCLCVVKDPAMLDLEAGLDVLSERLLGFLADDRGAPAS